MHGSCRFQEPLHRAGRSERRRKDHVCPRLSAQGRWHHPIRKWLRCSLNEQHETGKRMRSKQGVCVECGPSAEAVGARGSQNRLDVWYAALFLEGREGRCREALNAPRPAWGTPRGKSHGAGRPSLMTINDRKLAEIGGHRRKCQKTLPT